MFNPNVTPLDRASNAHRALRSHAELRDVPIKQLSVSAPRTTEQIDTAELATAAEPASRSSPPSSYGANPAIAGPVSNGHGSRP
jgi:hypothetical protein